MFEIRDDIADPKQGERNRKPKYPTKKLEVGQSFLFPLKDMPGVRGSARYWRLREDKRFKVFKYDEERGACKRTR